MNETTGLLKNLWHADASLSEIYVLDRAWKSVVV